MAGNLALLSGMVADKLDSNAGAFWNNAELRQFHRGFKEVHSLLQRASSGRFDQNVVLNSLFTHLGGLISEVDDLVDDWVQSEISRSKFDDKLRGIAGRLAPILNSLRNVVSGATSVNF